MSDYNYVLYYVNLEKILSNYVRLIGRIKFEKIYEKIHTSSSVNKLIFRSKMNYIAPSVDNFYTVSTRAIKLGGVTVGKLGAIIALQKWHEECNTEVQLFDDLEMVNLLDLIEKRF